MSYFANPVQEVWTGTHVNGADYAGYASIMQPTPQPHYNPSAAAATSAASAAAPASLQPVVPKELEDALSYAALREAAAVNRAADHAAQEAQRAIALAQQAMHAALNPDPAAIGADAMYNTADEAGPSRRRNNGTRADHAGAAALLSVGQHAPAAAPSGRPNKGLRHFSMKVCEKVESKGTTSYNEVADELVAELKDGTMDDGICYDEKNIRRRVYDAINVLMALDIIAKEKKAIIWKGFPTSRSAAQQLQRLQGEQYAALAEIGRKATYLSELVEQQKALKHLLDRNSRNPAGKDSGTALHLPFILVQSKPDATVEVQISEDMQDVQFNFYNYPFEIHDDALVLKKMLEHDEMEKRRISAEARAAAVAAGAATAGAGGADIATAVAALAEVAAAQAAQQDKADVKQEPEEPQQLERTPPEMQAAAAEMQQQSGASKDEQQKQQQGEEQQQRSEGNGTVPPDGDTQQQQGQQQSLAQQPTAEAEQCEGKPAAGATSDGAAGTTAAVTVDDPMVS